LRELQSDGRTLARRGHGGNGGSDEIPGFPPKKPLLGASAHRTVTVIVDELAIPVIHLDDLIANKLASGRPQDLADADALEHIRRGA